MAVLFGCLKNHGVHRKDRVVQEADKGGLTQLPLADMRMPVLAASTRHKAVVHMKQAHGRQPGAVFDVLHATTVALIGMQGIACTEGMGRIEADSKL